MAKALQCPNCGSKHRLDTLPDTPTFRCRGCGQVLKVPAVARPPAAAPEPAPRPTPTPRPRAAAKAVAPEVPEVPEVPARRGGPRRVPWWFRVLAWVVALLLGGVITVAAARAFGFLSRQQLRDVVLRTSTDRYWPVLRLVPVWALLTALLVTLAVEVWRRRPERRPRPDGPARGSGRGRGTRPPEPPRDRAERREPARVGTAGASGLPPPSRQRRASSRRGRS